MMSWWLAFQPSEAQPWFSLQAVKEYLEAAGKLEV